MSQAPAKRDVNLYNILGLPSPTSGSNVTSQQVKSAFRRALLRHHPDKSKLLLHENDVSCRNGRDEDDTAHGGGSTKSSATTPPKPTVDDLRFAREILLDPAKRHEYDRKLLMMGSSGSRDETLHGEDNLVGLAGLDTVDLDDMDFDEDNGVWSRFCRCGNDAGFQITADELDIAANADETEVVLSCVGCSLYIRVVFQVADG